MKLDGRYWVCQTSGEVETIHLPPEEEPPLLAPLRARRWPSGDLIWDELAWEDGTEARTTGRRAEPPAICYDCAEEMPNGPHGHACRATERRTLRPWLVDVAVDQGGCVATTRPTTLLDPVHTLFGVVHYGVANMPALVPRTSTFALTNATLPFVLELGAKGPARAVRENPALAKGVNVWGGKIVHPGVAESVNERPVPLEKCLG